MKRVIVCLVIIGVIIATGIFSCAAVAAKNDRLYGHIESVLSAYDSGGDASSAIDDLERYFRTDYAPKLACIIDDEMIGELALVISRLKPMYESDCDEFSAECEAVRASAERIYKSEVPSFFRIL